MNQPNDVQQFLHDNQPMSIEAARTICYELGQRYSKLRREADHLENRANQLRDWIKTMERWQDFQTLVADAEKALKGEVEPFVQSSLNVDRREWPAVSDKTVLAEVIPEV